MTETRHSSNPSKVFEGKTPAARMGCFTFVPLEGHASRAKPELCILSFLRRLFARGDVDRFSDACKQAKLDKRYVVILTRRRYCAVSAPTAYGTSGRRYLGATTAGMHRVLSHSTRYNNGLRFYANIDVGAT